MDKFEEQLNAKKGDDFNFVYIFSSPTQKVTEAQTGSHVQLFAPVFY